MSEPTIVCVLGMHRSGTSLVAQLLHALGLDLGPEQHLMGPSEANPTGHWENEPIKELNDEILEYLGGTWWEPPTLTAGWERTRKLDRLRRRARKVIEEEFGTSSRWGFKDPRTCLTLPLWQRVLPPMRYVICLRNPVDVAWSLHARKDDSLPFEQGADLWLAYTQAMLAATAGQRQLMISYEDLMAEPEPVVRRLARFIDLGDPASGTESSDLEAAVKAAIRVARRGGLWHHRTSAANVVDEPRLSFQIKALYLALRLFSSGGAGVEFEALDLLSTYAAHDLRQQAELEQRLAERRADLDRIAKERADEHRRHKEREAELDASRANLRAELEAARAELEAARSELERLRDAAPDDDPEATGSAADDATASAYRALIEEVRARAREALPAGATVLVASKGDEQLLRLEGCKGLHFPAGGDDGRYLGWHPAGDTAVIAQLEAMRAAGADHLLLPATTLWWLDHYLGLRRHLEERYVPLVEDERCVIYDLGARPAQAAGGAIAALKRAIESIRIESGGDPSVLDWRTGLDIGEQFPDVAVFLPPGDGEVLPYIDRSVDVVVLATPDPARLAEARRVAARAVLRVDPSSAEVAELEWSPRVPNGWGRDVSVTLVPDSDEPTWDMTLGSFAETLNGGFAGELSVIGPSSTLVRARDAAAAAGAQVRLIETTAEASFAQRAAAAIDGTGHSVNVFVTGPAVALPDWLPSLLGIFSRDPAAGVVGARILSRFGSLAEAGGVLAADGSRRRRGEGDENPDRPEYCFVKRVDFCSAPLVATRREVLERLSGFGADAAPADAVVDFSLRAGQAGTLVYYQPRARIVRMRDAAR